MKTNYAPLSFARASSKILSVAPFDFQKPKTLPFCQVLLNRVGGAMAVVALSLLLPVAARAQIYQINVMPPATLYQASNTQTGSPPNWFATRPHAYSFDVDNGGAIVKKIMLSWLVNPDYNPDDSPALHLSWRRLSLDGGNTWGTSSPHTVSNAAAMSVIRRRNGEMLALSFRPPEGYFKSTDNAVTWTKYTDGSTNVTMLFHRGILEDNDGNLYAPGYSAHDIVLVKSTNGGKDWTELSRPANGNTDGDGRFYSEGAIERCADGSWLMVARVFAQKMRYRRSTNQGVSWLGTGTSDLVGLPARNASVPEDCDPALKLMPNGVLVLSYGPKNDNEVSGYSGGSRDCHIAFSNDGNGVTWSNDVATLVGLAYDPSDGNPPIGLESSGYTEAVPVTAHRFMTVGDNGHTWSYSSLMLTPNPYKIWGRYVDIVRTPYNRIDLKTMLALNPSMVTTDLTYTSAANPEARVSGAVDGSNDYWSGAFKSGASGVSGTYTIDLQRNHAIDAVGVCMHYNTAQSATVQVATSLAGPWTNVVTYANVVQNALVYTNRAPISARYVRATVTAAAGQAKVCLNEIELYSTAYSFENSVQNTVPYLYDAPPNFGFYVTEGVLPLPSGYQSTRALYLIDTLNETAEKSITQTRSTTTSKTLEFMLRPKAYATGNGAIQWRLLSGTTIAFRFRSTAPSGQIQWYNGSAYTSISGAFAPTDTWTRIKVVATATAGADTASLYVNDVLKGALNSIGSENNVSSMNKLQFASGGAAASGDKALFDDVYMN